MKIFASIIAAVLILGLASTQAFAWRGGCGGYGGYGQRGYAPAYNQHLSQDELRQRQQARQQALQRTRSGGYDVTFGCPFATGPDGYRHSNHGHWDGRGYRHW